jgi:GGDEF domain-containing protein
MNLVPRGLPDDLRKDAAPTTADLDALAIGMLPPRAAVLDRLAEVLPAVAARPMTLLIVGLRRRDDGWAISPEALDSIVAIIARELRADDWLALSGPAEFAVLASAPVLAVQTAAERLLSRINEAAARDMTASAGIAALAPELEASEVLRRATLCLATARAMEAGQVITYSGTR